MIEREVTDDGIATLRLAHGKANTFDVELSTELAQVLEAEAQSGSRAVILTGTGSIFSAGVDLFRLVEGGPEYARQFYAPLRAAIERMFTFPKPFISAANGHAIAGGGIAVLVGDYRLMADGKGRIGVPELLVGVPFPAIALEVVRYGVPAQHIRELVFEGATLTPSEALSRGFIDEVVAPEQLLQRAHEAARKLAQVRPEAFGLTKRQLRHDAVERAEKRSVWADAEAVETWAHPATHAYIREYLAKMKK